jgi:hypothetical protein
MIALAFLMPALEAQLHYYLVILPIAAEVGVLFYLLTIGVRAPPARQTTPPLT